MEFLIYQLTRVPVISVRYFCLIKNVLCNFVWFTKENQMYIYCIHLFMSLFIIPLQTVFGKSFAKPLAISLSLRENTATHKTYRPKHQCALEGKCHFCPIFLANFPPVLSELRIA